MRFFPITVCVCAIIAALIAAEPPMPQVPASVMERFFSRSIGAQNPYATVIDVRVTNTVTTVYDLSYLRAIRALPTTNAEISLLKTNYLLMDTNVISVTTNTSPIKLE